MTRTQIINSLAKKHNYNTYLEIGVNNGINFHSVICENKIGVDPDTNSKATVKDTSDNFFNTCDTMFDVVFVDGLHHAGQTHTDIINALKHLNEGGTVVVHDCNPVSEGAQIVPRIQKLWNGDVWKAWVKLRQERSDLFMFVVDTDHGCGIIQKGSQDKLLINNEINYKNFEIEREKWLNLKTKEYYTEWLEKSK